MISLDFRSGGVHWDSEASMTYGVRTACEFSETTLCFPVARSKHSLRVCFGCRSGPRRRMHRRFFEIREACLPSEHGFGGCPATFKPRR